jgi:hypothetical protein
VLTDKQLLAKLTRAEGYLKNTKAGYTPSGPWWKRGMPLLWEVRQALGNTEDGRALARAHGILRDTDQGYDPRARRWREAMALIDQVEANLFRPPVPNLGRIVPGGKTLLLCQLTHNTDGLEGEEGSMWPALDDGWEAGEEVFAPEVLRVYKQSGSAGGDAFFAAGESGLHHWVGHLTRAPANGRVFTRGEIVGVQARIPGDDHVHWAINARPLIGFDLKYGRNGNGPDYTYGSPTIGVQLTKALVL